MRKLSIIDIQENINRDFIQILDLTLIDICVYFMNYCIFSSEYYYRCNREVLIFYLDVKVVFFYMQDLNIFILLGYCIEILNLEIYQLMVIVF